MATIYAPDIPPSVRAWAEQQLRPINAQLRTAAPPSRQLAKIAQNITRLVSNRVMRDVWRGLTELEKEFGSFSVLGAVIDVTTADATYTFMPRAQLSKIAEISNKIQINCRETATLIRQHSVALGSFRPKLYESLCVLDRAASESLDPHAHFVYKHEVSALIGRQQRALQQKNIERYIPEPAAILDAIADFAVTPVETIELSIRPTKAAYAGAARIYAVRKLSRRFSLGTGRPHHGLVAELVNVVFDDPTIAPLDERAVRGLIKKR